MTVRENPTIQDADSGILKIFLRSVSAYPEKIAVIAQTRSYTYSELNRASGLMADYIYHLLGDEPRPVALLLDDGAQIVAALLGVLRSGHFYSILSSKNPPAHTRKILNDLDAPLLIASSSLIQNGREAAPQGCRTISFDDTQKGNDPAFYLDVSGDSHAAVYYTSGSTGEPKGVLRSHRLMVTRGLIEIEKQNIQPDDQILLCYAMSTTATLSTIFGALFAGASLHISDVENAGIAAIKDVIWLEKITYLRIPVELMRYFLDSLSPDAYFSSIRCIGSAGDILYFSDLKRLRPHVRADAWFVTQLGISEFGSVAMNRLRFDQHFGEGIVPVGLPFPGKEIIILGEDGKPLDTNEIGEICVRTDIKFSGYWNQPDLTSAKIIPDPANPSRVIYRTGDMGRIRLDGQLELAGRRDERVKIRGYSVDMSSVESVLMSIANVRRGIVTVHQTPAGQKRLVAYVLPGNNVKLTAQQLRQVLAAKLPDYMLPSRYVILSELPLTRTGKVDRKRLPELTNVRPDLETDNIAPSTEIETQIAGVWQKLLELDAVGVTDNFFDLGGDSLMALEMTLEVEKLLSRTVPQTFFKHPTISSLATLLEKDIQTEVNREKFVIESYKKATRPPKTGISRKITTSNFKKLATKVSSFSVADKLDRLVDLVVARYIVSKSYLEANQWIVNWSQNALTRDILYRRRYALFSRWVASQKECHVQPSDVFQMNLLTNMMSGLARYLGKDRNNTKSDLQTYKKSSYPYLRTFGELLDAIPTGQLSEHFPISGVEYLMQAYQHGRGVILLAFHGTATGHRFFALKRFLNVENIPTISYQIPIRQSQYRNTMGQMSDTIAATTNSEIAFYGQRKLQEGKIINIASDTSDMHGKRYRIALAGREYQIKSGFAELALNTGAAIIPHFRCCLPDGRVQLNLGKPLDAGNGDRGEKIERLIKEYHAFINHVWATRPEVIRWNRMTRHFAQKAVGD